MVGQIGGGLDHASGVAGRTDITSLAGVGNQEVVPAVVPARPRKAVGQDAAFEVAAEFPPGYRRCGLPGAVILKRQPGGKMRLHGAIEQRAFEFATAVDGTAR